MVYMPSILRLIRNHINVFILDDQKIRTNYGGAKNEKEEDQLEFTITYKNYKYTFQKLDKTDNMLFLYSYDKLNNDCVVLTIDKKSKTIILTSFGKSSGCFREETNIGSNLLKITLKMVNKYKNKLGVNKFVLSDTSTYKCKTGEDINMAIMSTLLTGHTWYGKYGFRPYTKKNELDIDNNKAYEKNVKIMNKIKVSDINMKKHLLKINQKYPNEFTEETINDLLIISQDKLVKDFLSELFDKSSFDLTCKYLFIFFEKLFKELKLELPLNHYYGKKLDD
jgi:hypothetical protein